MKKLLIRYLTRYLNWVSEDDILLISSKGVRHKGRYLSKDQVTQLTEQAKSIRGMYLWKVMRDEVSYVAQLMFIKARDYDGTVSARLLLRAIEVIEQRLASLEVIEKNLQQEE